MYYEKTEPGNNFINSKAEIIFSGNKSIIYLATFIASF